MFIEVINFNFVQDFVINQTAPCSQFCWWILENALCKATVTHLESDRRRGLLKRREYHYIFGIVSEAHRTSLEKGRSTSVDIII